MTDTAPRCEHVAARGPFCADLGRNALASCPEVAAVVVEHPLYGTHRFCPEHHDGTAHTTDGDHADCSRRNQTPLFARPNLYADAMREIAAMRAEGYYEAGTINVYDVGNSRVTARAGSVHAENLARCGVRIAFTVQPDAQAIAA